MALDVNGIFDQTKLNTLATRAARRKPVARNASHLMPLRVVFVVDNIVDSGIRNCATNPVIHLSHLPCTTLNRRESVAVKFRHRFLVQNEQVNRCIAVRL